MITARSWDAINSHRNKKGSTVVAKYSQTNNLNGHRYKQWLRSLAKPEQSGPSIQKKRKLAQIVVNVIKPESSSEDKTTNAADSSVSHSQQEWVGFILRRVNNSNDAEESNISDHATQTKQQRNNISESRCNMDGSKLQEKFTCSAADEPKSTTTSQSPRTRKCVQRFEDLFEASVGASKKCRGEARRNSLGGLQGQDKERMLPGEAAERTIAPMLGDPSSTELYSLKLQIKKSCEAEIDQIQKKYEMQLRNTEMAFTEKKKALETRYNHVFINKSLAETILQRENSDKTTSSQGNLLTTFSGNLPCHQMRAPAPHFRSSKYPMPYTTSLPSSRVPENIFAPVILSKVTSNIQTL